MEELFKNPLLGQKNEFIEGENNLYFDVPDDIQNAPNPLAINLDGYDIKDSPFADNPVIEDKKESPLPENLEKPAKRRLNDLDFNILQDSAIKKAGEEFSGNGVLGKFLYKYFPKIYKSFLMKKALNKLSNLNQTAKDLISTKTIPYGESDERYGALIEYLSSANTIHAKIMKKI